jgi:hypothetical protein
MPWECRNEPKLSACRRSVAARGGVTEKTLSTDLAEARWCDCGHVPQMREVTVGIISTCMPQRKVSNPRKSMTLKTDRLTEPESSTSTSTRA